LPSQLPYVLRDCRCSWVVALHNSQQIDLLSLTTTPGFMALDGIHFFSVQQVFCGMIPHLDTPLDQMMAAVQRLVEMGGRDGAAGLPYNAFKAWLDRDPTRARAVVAAADAGDNLNEQFLAIAVEALGDTALAKRVAAQYSDERRRAGLNALGRIKAANEVDAEAAFCVLRPYCGRGFDDPTRFAAINAAFAALKGFNSLYPGSVRQIVAAVGDTPTDLTRFALLQALWLHEKIFNATNIKATLDVARGGDFAHAGLVNTVDVALQQLLGTIHRNVILEDLLCVSRRAHGSDTRHSQSGTYGMEISCRRLRAPGSAREELGWHA
jgi:hypothetical protein